MSSLSHHGIKGQRWGVRRYQNKDGTRTAAGKKQEKQNRLKATSKDYASIRESLSDNDLKMLNYSNDEIKYMRKHNTLGHDHIQYGKTAHRVIQKDKNGTPVTYVDATWFKAESLLTGKKAASIISIDLATRAGDEYRGKGHAIAAGKKMVKWFDTYGYKDYEYMEWAAKEENVSSQKTAEKLGFKKLDVHDEGWTLYAYEHKAKHTAMDASPYLSHHGIKGQRWGVRRYQNKDGTLTREGQIRFAKKNLKHAKVRNLDKWGKSPDSNVLYIIGTSGSGKSTTAKGLAEDGDQVIHLDTIFEKENHGSPDSNKDFEAFLKENNVDITKASDFSIPKEERWQTYDAIGDLVEAYGKHCFTKGSKVVIEGVQMGDQTLYPDKNYFNGKPTVVLKSNIVRDTFRADRRDGVPLRKTVVRLTDKERWNWYKQVNATSNEIKYTSIGGTMYIEGNALILGDSSYLEHHGIKGQRWGVRRFQNRDGSLTNAGRKRLGYATKSAVQTVSKAFKAGVKVGGNAVKAAKAHHEEAEAKKKEKKKEKASRSRLGVLANKDLFTDDELRALNQRFKVEDELKMASIQKGVEIAKAVGTIASNAATAAKAYEDITGQSLSPIKRKAAELKEQQDAEDRARKIAKEDAEEARKAAQEERDIKKFDQDLRKATAEADKSEFLAKKTKAQADQEILKALKQARDFDKPDDDDDDPPKPPNGGGGDGNPPGGGSDDGSSWVQRATAGGKNIFEQMKYDSDPEYRAAKDAHDEKVAQKERMAELDQREKERQAEKAAKDQALMDMINQSNARTGRGQSTPPKQAQPETPEPTKTPRQDSDALFSQKGSLPIDKGRYKNSRAASRAKQFKDDVEEERTKKQDNKAAKAAIDTIIKDYQRQDDTVRNLNPSGYDRQVALSVIKSKAKNTVDKVKHPVDTVAKKISDKAREEKWAKERAKLYEEYQDDREKLGPEFANETYLRAKRQSLQNLGYRGEALEKKLNENSFSKKKKAKHDAFSIQNGVLFVDYSDGLTHHGIKGQRWGVRRFQNPDGTLTDAGKRREARRMGRELNALDRRQATASRNLSNLNRHYEAYNRKVGKLEYKKSISDEKGDLKKSEKLQRKIDKGKANVERIGKMMDFASNDYNASEAQVKSIISKINKSTDYAWKSMEIEREFTSYNGGFYRDMKNKAGRQKLFEGDYYQSAYGNHYTVKYDKTGKRKRKWEASKQQRHTHNPIHTVYYSGLGDHSGDPYLEHHGIRGQRWGVRRFQNADGTLTEAGKKRPIAVESLL